MSSCGAERKNIYLHIFYLLCLQLGEPLKRTVVVLHSSPKFTIKTHCSQAEKNIEERSMRAICEHHADKARTPPAPQERKSEHLLSSPGQGKVLQWAVEVGGVSGGCRGAFVARSQPDVPRASKRERVHVCNFQQFVRFKGSPPIPPDRQIKSPQRSRNNSKHAESKSAMQSLI